jgi:hypothetical protein
VLEEAERQLRIHEDTVNRTAVGDIETEKERGEGRERATNARTQEMGRSCETVG